MDIRDVNVPRFWSYVEIGAPEECWKWNGGHIPSGYGSFSVKNIQRGAHRVMYLVANGELPPGLVVRHACNNKGCVNPSHLSVGTQLDNMHDRLRSGNYERGEGHYLARLDADKVYAARVARLNGDSYGALAKRYNVNSGTIYDAVNGNTWRHVPFPAKLQGD